MNRNTLINPRTTLDFERALNDLFQAASSSGEAFVDVTQRELFRSVAGDSKGGQGNGACRSLMIRMMIPGDCDLSPTYKRTAMRIRFQLPRPVHPRRG